MKDHRKEHWTEIISPRTSLLDLRLSEVWRYRDLLLLFVKRDFVATYKQTILGPVWNFIQPVFTTITFLVLFNKIANFPTDGIPPILFYLCGITIWNYFQICLMNTSLTFVTNAPIFGKVYFPRLVLPLSIILSNFIRFGIQFGLLLVVIIYYMITGQYHPHPGYHWVLIPVFLLMMAGMGLGLGIIISSITTKYRDFNVFMNFGVQLLMYLTPVAYPLSYLRGKEKYEWIINLNPLSSIVEGFRYAVFGTGVFNIHLFMYSLIFMILALLTGVMLFNKVERTFMDTV